MSELVKAALRQSVGWPPGLDLLELEAVQDWIKAVRTLPGRSALRQAGLASATPTWKQELAFAWDAETSPLVGPAVWAILMVIRDRLGLDWLEQYELPA